MMINIKTASAVIGATLWLASLPAAADKMDYNQVLQRIIDNHPSLEISRLQVARAHQGTIAVRAQLAWQLAAQAGTSHDLSPTLGVPADTMTGVVSLQKPLSFGGSLGISGTYTSTNATGFPDSALTRFDAQYRMPLGRGAGNPGYQLARTSAEQGALMARAGELGTRMQMASQTLELFHAAAVTHARLGTAREAVNRARRFRAFIAANARLGLSEKKDRLQAEAQLAARIADLDALQAAWVAQRTNLNHLMGRAPQAALTPVLLTQSSPPLAASRGALDAAIAEAVGASPDVIRLKARIEIADAQLRQAKDSSRATIDVVLGAGVGQMSLTPGGSQSDTAASARIEFRTGLNRRAINAQLVQARIDHDIAMRDLTATQDALRYTITRLVEEYNASARALSNLELRHKLESQKYAEAKLRYRRGRSSTQELIQFENELTMSEFALIQQRAAVIQRQLQLTLLRGKLWQSMKLPAIDLSGAQ